MNGAAEPGQTRRQQQAESLNLLVWLVAAAADCVGGRVGKKEAQLVGVPTQITSFSLALHHSPHGTDTHYTMCSPRQSAAHSYPAQLRVNANWPRSLSSCAAALCPRHLRRVFILCICIKKHWLRTTFIHRENFKFPIFSFFHGQSQISHIVNSH